MRSLKIKNRITDYLNRNKWQILIVFASLFAGIIIGSFFSARMSGDKYEAITEYIQNFVSAYGLQSVNDMDIFKFSVYNNIKLVLFLWLSGLRRWLLPIGAVQIGLKGYKIGFSTALFVRIFGIKGVLFAIISILPQLVITIPAVLLYLIFNINFALALKPSNLQHMTSTIKNHLYIQNLMYLTIMVAVSLVAALTDAYIIPPVLKPICSLLNR